jgi:hypothetical protein
LVKRQKREGKKVLIRRCSWCGKYLGIKIASFKQWRNWFKTTHGLCLECKKKIIDSVKKAGDKQLLTREK